VRRVGRVIGCQNERERGDNAALSTQRAFERWRGEESIRMWGDGKREDEMRDRVRTMAEWEGRNGEEVEMPRMITVIGWLVLVIALLRMMGGLCCGRVNLRGRSDLLNDGSFML